MLCPLYVQALPPPPPPPPPPPQAGHVGLYRRQHWLPRSGLGHGPVPHGHQALHSHHEGARLTPCKAHCGLQGQREQREGTELKRLLFSVLQVVIEQGGVAPGGLNFDCKVRRESTDLRDMFISHIGEGALGEVLICHQCLSTGPAGAMDTMARGLRCAAKLLGEGIIPRAVKVPPLTLPIPPHCSVSVFHLACPLSPSLPPSLHTSLPPSLPGAVQFLRYWHWS